LSTSRVYYLIQQISTASLSEQRRILIVRTDRLGDVILTLPMVAVLREWYPDAYLAMMLNRYTGEIVRGNPSLNEIIWDDRISGGEPSPGLVGTLRARKFSTVFVVHPTPRLAWLVACAGIPERIGTGYRVYSFFFNRKIYEHRKDARYHELEYNLHMLRTLRPEFTGDGVVPRYDINIDPAADMEVRKRIGSLASGQSLIVMHPGSGGSAHDWPRTHFAQLAGLVAGERRYRLVVTGGGKEDALVRDIAAAGKTEFAFAGSLSLPELAALYAMARVVVGNSTGPLHLAAAVGTRVIGLYSQITAMSPARWGPYTERKVVFVPSRPVDCRECTGGTPCACMASIPVEQVWQALKEQADE
jgi:heptosyltransferase III